MLVKQLKMKHIFRLGAALLENLLAIKEVKRSKILVWGVLQAVEGTIRADDNF